MVDAKFLETLDEPDTPASFTLGGRAWRVVGVEWGRGVCHVVPSDHAGRTRWSGSPRPLPAALCQSIRATLRSDEVSAAWSTRARDVMHAQREHHAFLRDDPRPLVREGSELRWWNFAGGRINTLLARMLEAELGGKVVARDFSVGLQGEAAASEVAARTLLDRWTEARRPNHADALRFAASASRTRLSKFEPCLAEAHLSSLQADALLT